MGGVPLCCSLHLRMQVYVGDPMLTAAVPRDCDFSLLRFCSGHLLCFDLSGKKGHKGQIVEQNYSVSCHAAWEKVSVFHCRGLHRWRRWPYHLCRCSREPLQTIPSGRRRETRQESDLRSWFQSNASLAQSDDFARCCLGRVHFGESHCECPKKSSKISVSHWCIPGWFRENDYPSSQSAPEAYWADSLSADDLGRF